MVEMALQGYNPPTRHELIEAIELLRQELPDATWIGETLATRQELADATDPLRQELNELAAENCALGLSRAGGGGNGVPAVSRKELEGAIDSVMDIATKELAAAVAELRAEASLGCPSSPSRRHRQLLPETVREEIADLTARLAEAVQLADQAATRQEVAEAQEQLE